MPNSEWPRIRTALRRHRDEVGYLTLSAYAGSGAGQQQMIGRLDLKDRMLRHWLDQVDSEDSAERLGDFLGALGRTIPSEDPDDDYTVVADEASAEAEDEDEEDESEEDDEGDDEDSDDEDDEDEATPSPAPVPTIPPLTNDEIEQGVRNWLDSTCEANTTDGSQATFRIRIYQHGGARQLWSALFRYESTAAVPIPPPPPTPALPPQPEAPSATPRSLLSRRLNMNDNGRGNGAPPYTPPSTYTPERVEKQANRVAADYAAGKGNGPAPYEVETLLHLHGLHRVFAASVLNTMSEQQKVYQKIIGELAGALSDARTHNDDLLDDVKALRLAEMEHVREAIDSNDKSQVRATLGREGMQQAGLLLRTLIQNKGHLAQATGPNGSSFAEGPQNYPDSDDVQVDEDGNVITPLTEEELTDLENWIGERPDVAQALNDPAVRAYLRTQENVDQLRSLAAVMAGDAEPPASNPGEVTNE